MSRSILIVPLVLLGCLASLSCRRHHPSESKPELVSLLGRPLHAEPLGANENALEERLSLARQQSAESPHDPALIVWVGRRLAYLGRMNEAVEVYTDGIAEHSAYAPLYRHRGHRFISLRRFDEAIEDLEQAARLIEGKPDDIEPDGIPNLRNIPLTTTAFNVWYHLGLARYLKGDFDRALSAYREAMKYTRGYDDNAAAVTDWMYMTLRRTGREEEASALLDGITRDMDIIENRSYHRRCLMYKGLINPEDLLQAAGMNDQDYATLSYGLGNWFLYDGDEAAAIEMFERITSGPQWAAFGFIAAEADLARLRARHRKSDLDLRVDPRETMTVD